VFFVARKHRGWGRTFYFNANHYRARAIGCTGLAP
jgi:hypothetical protein